MQMQERCVGFIGLDHDELAAAQFGVRPGTEQSTPDHERRIHAGFGQHARHETRRGGLAVGARHGDALPEAQQLGKHERPRNHRDAQLARMHDFRVVRSNGSRHDDDVRVLHVACRMPSRDVGTRA